MDQDLERRGYRFVRSADDCNIYARRVGERVRASVEHFLRRGSPENAPIGPS